MASDLVIVGQCDDETGDQAIFSARDDSVFIEFATDGGGCAVMHFRAGTLERFRELLDRAAIPGQSAESS